MSKLQRAEFTQKHFLISEKIADSIWEIWRASRTASHPVGAGEVTPEQYWILRLLYNAGPQRITDVASHIGTTSSPVTISVKRLERQNLVRRERSTADERVVKVQLTKHGRDQFELWRLRRRKSLSKIFDPLDENEKNSLLALLIKVVPRSDSLQDK
jgi:DNA-binding MarR family transcriptional regulator